MVRPALVLPIVLGVFALKAAGVSGTTEARPLSQNTAPQLVEQLRTLPTPLPPSPRRDDPVEARRRDVYQRLAGLKGDAVRALASALQDSDVSMRRSVATALNALAGTWWYPPQPPLDIRPCLPTLIAALEDSDGMVRAWVAQAIGEVGPDAFSAVPALIRLLADPDEASRNSACIALRGIGPAAKDALPALRAALDDPSSNVRGFARRAIEKSEGRR